MPFLLVFCLTNVSVLLYLLLLCIQVKVVERAVAALAVTRLTQEMGHRGVIDEVNACAGRV